MTGFDAPSVSTIYLDRPMRNHTLMQTIARANRVFPDKDNGLIVDYIGVFRNLEKALAIYGAANAEAGVDSPIQDVDALVAALGEAIDDVDRAVRSATASTSPRCGTRRASPTSPCATPPSRRCWSTRRPAPSSWPRPARSASCSRRCCPTRRPPPSSAPSPPSGCWPSASPTCPGHRRPTSTRSSDAVDALLDRSVGAEEYVIRAAAEGSEPDPLIDLSQIDFDALAAQLRRPQARRDRPARRTAPASGRSALPLRNPTRYDLVERIEELIADYNAGSLNIDEYLRRLIELSKTLTAEEAAGRRRRA